MTQPAGTQNDPAQMPPPDQSLTAELSQLQEELLAHLCEIDMECAQLGFASLHEPPLADPA